MSYERRSSKLFTENETKQYLKRIRLKPILHFCSVLIAGAMIAFPIQAMAQPTLTVGAPSFQDNKAGTITIDIFNPNVQPQLLNAPTGSKLSAIPKGQSVNDIQMPISIPARTGDHATTVTEKANTVADWINKVYGAPPNIASVTTNANGTATITLPQGALIKVEADNMNEAPVVASIPQPQDGLAMTMDWEGVLGGVTATGGISTYTASFGYDGLVDTATVSYDQLVTPTVDSLASKMFEQLLAGLPLSLQSRLSLDLAEAAVVFDVPNGHTNLFVSNDTTDPQVSLTGGIYYSTVPEPATAVACGLGLLSWLACRRRREGAA